MVPYITYMYKKIPNSRLECMINYKPHKEAHVQNKKNKHSLGFMVYGLKS